MKTVTFEQNFKTVTRSLADKVPALADRIGKKRESLNVTFSGFADAEDFASVPSEIVCFYLNKAIEAYGKSLVQENATDWSFQPSAESLTITAAYESDTSSVSRARTLTAATAGEFAKFYVSFGPQLLADLSERAALAGAEVIKKFSVYSAQENYCVNMTSRLLALSEALLEQDEDSPALSYVSEVAESGVDLFAVLSALISKFDPASLQVVTADAL